MLCDSTFFRGFSAFPRLLISVSVHVVSYSFHAVVAASTLVILVKQGTRNPYWIKHISLTALLFVLGTINISVYLLSLTFCSDNYQELGSTLLATCLEWDHLHPIPSNFSSVDERGLPIGLSGLPEYNPACKYDHTTGRVIGAREMWDTYFPGLDYSRGQDVVALLISILAQSYLLLRCHLLLGRRFVTVGMGLVLLTSIAFGISNVILLPFDPTPTSLNPYDIPLTGSGIEISRVFWGLSLAFNLAANALIIGRLIWLRSRVGSLMGKEYGRIYTGLAAMLMESSALYTIVLVVAYTSMPGNGGAANMFSPLVAQTEAIAAELIILRFALGRSLSRKDVVTLAAPELDASTASTAGELAQTSRRAVARAQGRAHESIMSTISMFPSSVAAVIRSHLGDGNNATKPATVDP